MAEDRPLTATEEAQIRALWQLNIHTADIAVILQINECRVEPVTRAHVAAKKGRKASD